ncbi:hypothetical protein [Tenacibaculum maritimum]|uniref:hypothetical protein n=1 Tax=Tenacibaculum maritimum TaxID=107401 RepID=UPI00388F0DC3
MKKHILITIFTMIYFQKTDAQVDSVIHLSYNLDSKSKGQKYLKDKITHFYIKNEHFTTKRRSEIFNEKPKNIDLINIDQFINISEKERERLVKEGEKKGVIKMLKNSEIFKTIYLYEKKDCRVYKYNVKWIDEIVN